jgi:hypothetical protein
MRRAFFDHFRCPEGLATTAASSRLSDEAGFFRFEGMLCYGRSVGRPSPLPSGTAVPDVSGTADPRLPFDLSEVVDNLQRERYPKAFHTDLERWTSSALARSGYYLIRPLLGVRARKHLQRLRLGGWTSIPFPSWPVDLTVENLMQSAMVKTLRAARSARMPFIWFWPDGARSCVMMTHDVEGRAGRAFSPQLMDLDDAAGIKSSFQVVPESLVGPPDPLVQALRDRGFEVNLHDLNHDGSLFRHRHLFERRARQINRYAKELGCHGFRSGAMYREQDWYSAFEFSYDMSVPNVAHLEPQRGGCCTVMPYFIGDVLELPLTTTQDYSLFHILGDYSMSLWETQIETIRSRNGLISFITHPDYLIEPRARGVYIKLLARLRQLQSNGDSWVALPGEVNRWWRNRNEMRLVQRQDGWQIEGRDSDRARVAYATLDGDRVVYEVEKGLRS